MSTCRTVQPVSSGGSAEARSGRANWRRLIGGPRRRQSRVARTCRTLPRCPEQRVVGVAARGLLELEQRGPVGLGVDEGRRDEVAEDAHAVAVDRGEAVRGEEGEQPTGASNGRVATDKAMAPRITATFALARLRSFERVAPRDMTPPLGRPRWARRARRCQRRSRARTVLAEGS